MDTVKIGDWVTWGNGYYMAEVEDLIASKAFIGTTAYVLDPLDGTPQLHTMQVPGGEYPRKGLRVVRRAGWQIEDEVGTQRAQARAEIDKANPTLRGPIASDGGSTAYYAIPDHATELKHLISAQGMSFARGNVFKACYRLGRKSGADVLYDLRKMEFFVQELIEMHERGEDI